MSETMRRPIQTPVPQKMTEALQWLPTNWGYQRNVRADRVVAIKGGAGHAAGMRMGMLGATTLAAGR